MFNSDQQTTHKLFADYVNDSRWDDIIQIQEEYLVVEAERACKEMNKRIEKLKDRIENGVKRAEENL